MKILDRYIIRELVIPIAYCSIILVALILIADLFNNLDDFLRNHTSFFVILRYYLCLIPYSFTQTIGWATWMGTLFLLVNLGFHNETMAMKAVGLKITSIVRPMLFLGFLIGIFVFLLNDSLVPKTYRSANELGQTYISKKQDKNHEKLYYNVTYYSGQNQLYYFRTFSRSKEEVGDVIALWLGHDENNPRKKMAARRGQWRAGAWEFEGVTEYQMDSRGRVLGEPKTYPRKVYPEINFTPKELVAASSESLFLTYRELKQSIEKLKENGIRVYSETVDLQSRLASPWQALVMMLITIPLLARTTNRKVIALNVLVCVGLAFSFHILGAVGIALGKAGKLYPFWSAWFGNIIFAAGAFMHLDRANY